MDSLVGVTISVMVMNQYFYLRFCLVHIGMDEFTLDELWNDPTTTLSTGVPGWRIECSMPRSSRKSR